MKVFMDFEEHQAMKEKRSKKIKAKEKQVYDYEDESKLIMKKNGKKKKFKKNRSKNRLLENNYKRLEYDYEEDFYDLDYEID